MSSTIVMPESYVANMSTLEQEAIVIAVGPEAWKDEKEPRALVGDLVIVAKYAGHQRIGKDGKQYRFVNARDLFGAIEVTEPEAENA